MRKRCLALAAVVLSLQITGCGAINLTTQERNVIAEYIANILLKHDKTYQPTLQYDFEEEEDIEEPEQEETENNMSIEQEQNTDSSENEIEETGQYVDISEVYNKELSVSPMGYSFYQTYPKKTGNAILPIEASSGNTICVVHLKVKNTSSSTKKIDFLLDNYSYQLDANSQRTYNAVQSLLVDDIQYLDVTLKSGKSYEAVVAFEISKKMKKKQLNLLITKGSKTASVILK